MFSYLAQVFGSECQNPYKMVWLGDFPEQPCLEPDEHDDPFLATEIEFLISKMAPHKAPGSDHITGAMVKPIA